jgi:hypothetical protein
VQAKSFPEWIQTDKNRSTYPSVIAIDCEMCETTDPGMEFNHVYIYIYIDIDIYRL